MGLTGSPTAPDVAWKSVKNSPMRRFLLASAIGFLSLVSAGGAAAQEIVSLSARPGITQSFFLARVPQDAQATAVLFLGSGGLLRLRREKEQIKFSSGNFLVRSRSEFINRRVVTAIVDAPSDQQGGWGMSDAFRLGEQHFADLSAVLEDLKERFPKLPVFLVGTSRGTISAASLAARFGPQVSGAVLTATMFREAGRRAQQPGPGLSRFDLASIRIPLLLVHHVSDQCSVTPYSDAARLSEKYPLITVFGGSPPQSGPCEAHSQHGFLGKEAETVEQIVNWMLKRPLKERVE
jgi:predicted alpha/beta hydrolase family esterase